MKQEKNLNARQVAIGLVIALCLGLYIGFPSVKKFVDGAWAVGTVRWHELRTDFREFYSLSAEEKTAIERTRIKKACDADDQKACQYLKTSKCPPGVSACTSYEKYEAKWRKKSS